MDLVQRLEATGYIDLTPDERFVDPLALFGTDENSNDDNNDSKTLLAIPTTVLTETRGKMLGVLVCEYGNATVVLCAFAGAIAGRWNVPGWVPPVGGVAPEDIVEWVEVQAKVAETTRAMENIQQQQQEQESSDGAQNDKEQTTIKDEWSRLRARRAAFSTQGLKVLRAEQRVGDFRSMGAVLLPEHDLDVPTMTLEDVYLESMSHRQRRRDEAVLSEIQQAQSLGSQNGTRKKQSKAAKKRRIRRMPPLDMSHGGGPITKGMPVGVGECCATKLIAFAVDHNRRVEIEQKCRRRVATGAHAELKLLTPVGIAEVFFGTSKQTQRPREGKGFPSAAATSTPTSPSVALEKEAKSSGAEAVTARKKQVKNLVDNDGVFYDACELRCQPVLGFMMCGLDS